MEKGTRVRLSVYAKSIFNLRKPDRLGTIVGFCRDAPAIARIIWDGTKGSSVATYDIYFLEVAE